jgi:Domain of unknown function (DUF3459)
MSCPVTLLARHWRDNPIYAVKLADQGGFGFDAFWSDGLRTSIGEVISSPSPTRLSTGTDGLSGPTAQKEMQDHLRFTQDLIWLRRRHPALRGEKINVFHVHNDNRIIAFHRWIEGVGRDVVVIASLREETYYNHTATR